MDVILVSAASSKMFQEFVDSMHTIGAEYNELVIGTSVIKPVEDLYVDVMGGSLDDPMAGEQVKELTEIWDYINNKSYNFAIHCIKSYQAMGTNILILDVSSMFVPYGIRRYCEEHQIKHDYIHLYRCMDDRMSNIISSNTKTKDYGVVNHTLLYGDTTKDVTFSQYYKMFRGIQ